MWLTPLTETSYFRTLSAIEVSFVVVDIVYSDLVEAFGEVLAGLIVTSEIGVLTNHDYCGNVQKLIPFFFPLFYIVLKGTPLIISF